MFSLNQAKRLCRRCVRLLQAALRAREELANEAIRRGRAEQKSLSLLLNLLSEEQRRDFQTYGFFYALGGNSGDRYRIRVDSAVNIDVLAGDGTVKYHLCARPSGNIPMYDVMAAQLLYLQDRSSETHFLDQANRHVTLSFTAMMRSRSAEHRP